MHGLLYPSLAVLAWCAAGYRLVCAAHRWRRLGRDDAGTPAQHAVTSALALLAVTFTVSTPAVWTLADRVTGVNNIAALIAHLCVVGFSTTIQVLLLWWANPAGVARRKAYRRLAFLLAVAVLLLVLFVAAGPTEPHSTDFVATYAHRPLFSAYLLAYLAAFSTGLVDIIRICWRYARLAGPGALRAGLRTTAVGAAIGLVYCATRGLGVIGVASGWGVRRWEWLIPISASSGAFLVILGLTMPTWAPWVSAASGTPRRLRHLRQLHPLWAALSTAVPTVRLVTGSGGRGHVLWRPAQRLHRRVIEIYDARLVLRPYLDAAVGEAARLRAEGAGLRGDELAAVVEAAKLRAALRALRDGARPERPEQPVAAGSELDEVREVEQLVRVAHAFTRSPLVTSIVDDDLPDVAPVGR